MASTPFLHGLRRTTRWIWTHPSNRGQRFERLWRYAQVQAAGRTARGGRRPRAVVVPYGLHARMRCFLDPASSKRAAYYRVPDWPEMLVWQRVLEPGDLFVDIGANVGLYTIWAADLGAEVVAFEPVEPSRRQLQDNIDLNGFGCLVHEQAVGAEPGRVQMEGADLNRQHMVLDGGEPNPPTSGATAAVVDGPPTVEVVTLDDVLGERFAAGVKVDVEGAERLVLEGASRALAEGRIGLLQLEWNDLSESLLGESRSVVAEILRGHGYELYRPDELGRLQRDDGLDVRFGPDVFSMRPPRRDSTPPAEMRE